MRRERILLFTIAILCIFLACLSTNYDYDFFARLIVGERIIEHSIFPFKDFLSYTPTHPWFDHEWGSGFVFYFVLKYFGALGLVLLQAVLGFGTLFFVYKTQKLQKHSFPISLVFLSIFAGLFFYLNPSLVRSQMFSFFFFSLFLFLLEKSRTTRKTIFLWPIPIITIIWNNMHGGVVAGLGLVFIYALGEIIEKKNPLKYLITLSCSLPLLIINPYRYKYLDFLFRAVTMNRKYVLEWWPVFARMHIIHFLPVSAFILLGYISAIINFIKKKNIEITRILVITATLVEGFWHIKLLSFALIAVSALCYNDIFKIFINLKTLLVKIEKSLYAAIIVLGFTIPLYSPSVPRADFNIFPLKEIEFIKINNLKGNIAGSFGLSSFISYKLYPNNLIYMDGRFEEVYNNKEYMVLKDFNLAEKNWRDIVNNYPTDILMPEKYLDIYPILKKAPDWVLIFEGNLCGIFVRKENVKNEYIRPNYDINYYRENLFNSHFRKEVKND